MARRNDVLDWCSSAWFKVFSYFHDSEDAPVIANLQAIGVRDAAFQIGRLTDGSFFTNVTSVVAEKGQAVDVAWLMKVLQLCEAAGPFLLSDAVSVAGHDGDDPAADHRHLVAVGELLLFVHLFKGFEGLTASVTVAIPSCDVVETEAPA